MVKTRLAPSEHLLARPAEPGRDCWWTRGLAQHFLCASRGRCRFVTGNVDAGRLHIVSAGDSHALSACGQASSLRIVPASMARAWPTAARSMERAAQALVAEVRGRVVGYPGVTASPAVVAQPVTNSSCLNFATLSLARWRPCVQTGVASGWPVIRPEPATVLVTVVLGED